MNGIEKFEVPEEGEVLGGSEGGVGVVFSSRRMGRKSVEEGELMGDEGAEDPAESRKLGGDVEMSCSEERKCLGGFSDPLFPLRGGGGRSSWMNSESCNRGSKGGTAVGVDDWRRSNPQFFKA